MGYCKRPEDALELYRARMPPATHSVGKDANRRSALAQPLANNLDSDLHFRTPSPKRHPAMQQPISSLESSAPLEISASADRLRQLVDAVVDYGIFLLDAKGHVVSWNTGAQHIKGYTAQEVIGRHFSIFYTDAARSVDWPGEELKRAAADGRFEDEGWRVRKDGTQFWANVVITALRDPDGHLSGFGKVTRDLTERRLYEEALRESEQRFRLLVEGVKDYAIFMLSPSGIIESWNAGAELLKGYTSEEAIGRHFSMFYRPEELQADLPASELRAALAYGRAEEEGWRKRKDGSVFWANVIITPVYDGKKLLRGFTKVTRDMTDRRRLQELENSSRRMNEFLAMLAHELRNPLAPIRNAVTVLQLEPAPSPMVRSSRDMIDRQLSHMTRLVDDLLDAGRLTTGKIHLRKERVLFNQVLARAAEAVRPLMDAQKHRFVAVPCSSELYVTADATRLTQVVQNLLTNAAKYTPAGGDIELKAWVEAGSLFTAVTDNGIGISEEAIGRIFELFSQGDAQPSSKEGGLGIGLTLAKSLVEMHGGVLQAESAGIDKGSRFSFFIPNASVDGAGDTPSDAKTPRFLIVDDNRDAADSLAEILRLIGCTVKIAYGGEAALALADAYRPHAALVDLGMPGMNGFDVVRGLRAFDWGGKIQVAAVTGYGSSEDRQRTAAAGFDVHLVKPVDFSALQALLERVKERVNAG
jgi:PAS domain S-box-containing protein